MKIYLDTCSIQRPNDAPASARVKIEAEAVLVALDLVAAGKIELCSSDVLLYEISRNPDEFRKIFALETLKLAKTHIELNEPIEKRANELSGLGLSLLDALHLASAEFANATCFCTADDKLYNRAKKNRQERH